MSENENVDCFTATCRKCKHKHVYSCSTQCLSKKPAQDCYCVNSQGHPYHPHGQKCGYVTQEPVYKYTQEKKQVQTTKKLIQYTVLEDEKALVGQRVEKEIPFVEERWVSNRTFDCYRPSTCSCQGKCEGFCCVFTQACGCKSEPRANCCFYITIFLLLLIPFGLALSKLGENTLTEAMSRYLSDNCSIALTTLNVIWGPVFFYLFAVNVLG